MLRKNKVFFRSGASWVACLLCVLKRRLGLIMEIGEGKEIFGEDLLEGRPEEMTRIAILELRFYGEANGVKTRYYVHSLNSQGFVLKKKNIYIYIYVTFYI